MGKVLDDAKVNRDFWLNQKAALTGSHEEEVGVHTVERDKLDAMITDLQSKPQSVERDEAIALLTERRDFQQTILNEFIALHPVELANVEKEISAHEKIVKELEK